MKGSIDNVKETDSSIAKKAFLLIFQAFFTENNLAKRFIKGIVSKKLELSFGRVLENSNFYCHGSTNEDYSKHRYTKQLFLPFLYS